MRQGVVKMLALMAMTPYAFADIITQPMVLDRITFQVTAKEWVNTQTVLLSVSVNMTLTNADLVKARAGIMDKLNKIAKGDWHLTQFDRSQDSSGMETLFVQAQARVDQSAITDIYAQAKSVSVSGAKYEISNVEFKPSLEEIQGTYAKVRAQIYQQINGELARINKEYPSQNYSISNVMFNSAEMPQPRPFQAKEMNAMVATAAAAPLTVSNELSLTARVDVASNRKQEKM